MDLRPAPQSFPDLRPGDHLCCIYSSEDEHRAVLTPYLRLGLEQNEKILYIVDAHTAETILDYLRAERLDVDGYLASEQLTILTKKDAYLRDGHFDPDRMMALLKEETDAALRDGWTALRVTGEMTWSLGGEPGAERLIEYEARLNDFLPGSRCVAICQYDRRRFSPELLLDILHTHPYVILGTDFYDNFYYLPAGVFLSARPEGRLQQWIRALTDRAEAHRQIRLLNRLYRTISEVNQRIVREEDPDRLLEEICDVTVQRGEFRMGWIGIVDSASGCIRVVTASGDGTGIVAGLNIPMDGTTGIVRPAVRAVLDNRPSIVADIETDADGATLRDEAMSQGLRSCGAFPFRSGRGDLGVIQVYSAEPGVFRSDVVSLLLEIAGDVGLALGAIDARREKRASEARLRSLFEHLPVPTWEEDASALRTLLDELRSEGIPDPASYFRHHPDAARRCAERIRVIDVNRAALALHGARDKEELLAGVAKVLVPESFHTLMDLLLEVCSGATEAIRDGVVATLSGERRQVIVQVSVVPGFERSLERVLVSLTDITDRRQAEEAVRLSEQKYREIFEESLDGLFITSPEGRILDINKAGVAMFGYASRDEMRQLDLARDVYARSEDRARALAMVEARGTAEYDVPVKRRDGSEMFAHCALIAVRDESGAVVSYRGVIRDITDQHRAEEALRESERRYREVFENTSDCLFLMDVCSDGRFKFSGFNPAEERAVGISTEAVEGRFLEDVLSPQLAAQVTENYRRCLESGSIISYEEQLDLPTGRRSFNTALIPVRRPDGSIYRLVGVARDITTQRAAEEALRRSEARYRSLFEHSVAGVYSTTFEGEVLDANEAFARLLGTASCEEVRGAAIRDFYVRPEERDRLVRRIKADGSAQGVEVELRRADGASVWVVESAALVPDDEGSLTVIESTVIDITERKQLETEMRRSAAALGQAAETVVITDTDGSIQYVNPAFTRLTGYALDEVLGKNPRILKSGKQDERFYREMWATLTRGEVWHGRVVNKRKDGTLFEEDATISPVRDETGRMTHYVAVKRDVTQEVALESQLREAQKMEAVGRLAGGIAHDFNNLLQAMLSHVEILRQSPDQAATELDDLTVQVQRGAALAKQLLLFSRRQAVRHEPLDLNEVIHEVAKLLRRLVRENVEIDISTFETPVMIDADRGQMHQVMMNLAINAADAMPDGGRLWLSTGADHTSGWLEVHDTGGGIDEAIRDKIFEPFFTTKAAGQGTGLGLSVVHGIVTQHGGRIELGSSTGTGTTFRVTLPLVRTGPSEPTPVDVGRETLPQGRGERILVVEDEPTARDGLAKILSKLGYTVTAVGGAAEADALAPGESFDLLLTDIMLPDIHGAALAQGLRDRWPDLHVVLMSGYSGDDFLDRIGELGPVEFLQKPFDVDALAHAISRALSKR